MPGKLWVQLDEPSSNLMEGESKSINTRSWMISQKSDQSSFIITVELETRWFRVLGMLDCAQESASINHAVFELKEIYALASNYCAFV